MSPRGVAVLAALALAGCAGAPRAPEVGARPDPGMLSQWSASGRMAIAANGEGGNGSFAWAQDGGTTRLELRGPLGAGAVRLIVTAESLSLSDGDGRVLDADAARADLQARLGADLPWSDLRYWMLGLPAPGEPATVLDASASPWRVIEQSGWRLKYDSFADVGGLSLPQRFSAEHPSVRVRVVVDRWTPGGASPQAAGGAP